MDIEANVETETDPSMLKKLLPRTNQRNRIKKLAADGAMDTKDIFNLLEKEKIQPVVKIRKNASTRARGSPTRAKCVRENKTLGYEDWSKKYIYGMRWHVEGTFSAV